MPSWHWIIFLATAGLSTLLTYGVRQYALRTGLGVSVPGPRDVHTKPTPRLGGVAISVSFLTVCLLVYFFAPESLAFTQQTVWGIDKNLWGILLGVLILLGVGAYDDMYGLKPFTKLAFHILVGILLAASSVLVYHLTNPFGGYIALGSLTAAFVVFWVVLMINAINFLDGLDGLAGGVSLIATVVLYMLALKPEVNQTSMSVLAVILAGSLVGFLPFNFYPAKLFMGDSGSQVLGFLLAVFAIISGGKLATAFLVLGVPLLDLVWVVLRRIAAHQPPYKADRYHLHHRLLQAGLSQKQAVLLLYTISAAFGMIALQTQAFGKFIAALILIGIMIVGGSILVFLGQLKTRKSL